jgi:hypothetical protein
MLGSRILAFSRKILLIWFTIPQQTPLVWSFKIKDLKADSGQVFEE